MLKAWLKFFRVVNLPTVPGDVLVGAAATMAAHGWASSFRPVVAACVVSVFLYMFGLADNDIVGAKTDKGRPIADGQISLGAARWARGLCIFAALIVGSLANLPPAWWVVAFLLAVAIVVYNRTKGCLMMGLCRGFNVICGGSALTGEPKLLGLGVCAVLWTVYVAAVTKYSEGEEMDAAKKRRVGFLIGAIVYLQLTALLVAYLTSSCAAIRNLLLTGAALLIVLRLMKRVLPEVSAS